MVASAAVALAGCGKKSESTQSGVQSGTQGTTGSEIQLPGAPKQAAIQAQRAADKQIIDRAITSYYQENGQYPTSIGQLVPNYLRSIPTDAGGGTWYIEGNQAVVR